MAIGYTATQVSELLGIPYATLDSWVRNGFFVPSIAQAHGRGSRRLYSFFDIIVLKVVNQLRQQGMRQDLLSELIANMRNRQSDIEACNADYYLIFAEGVIIDILPKEIIRFMEEEDLWLENIFWTIPVGRFLRTVKFEMDRRGIFPSEAQTDGKVKSIQVG